MRDKHLEIKLVSGKLYLVHHVGTDSFIYQNLSLLMLFNLIRSLFKVSATDH